MQHIGKYKVIRELGAGGFGAVYLAEDPKLGVQLAIKVFQVRDENLAGQVTSASQDATQVLKQRFLAEAKTLHQLGGAQHIVQIRDYDEMDDGTPYYVMPYLPRSLVDEIGKDAFTRGKLEDTPKHQYPKKLASGRALLLLEQILTGLAAVHQAGLVHRDIKPANILLDSQNNVQICDFGIAKLPDTEHSQSGVGMGSRNYMSPEQRDSAKHVTPASDVYSVGVVAYRMLTGQLPDIPFQPVSAYAPEVGEPLSQLITQALAQQETQRPPDAGVFLQQFMQAIKSKGQSAGQGTHDEDATGTWIGGEANVKSELKPLQDRILTLLKQQGEITAKDMPVLQALADIGNLNEEDLQQLISHSQQQLANSNPQFKALHGWVNAINKQTEQGPLTQDKQQALIEAGIASTGKDKEELTALIATRQSKTASAKAKTATEEPPKQNSSKAETPEKQTASAKSVSEKTPEPKKSKAPLFAAVIVVVLSIGGYFGYETYQKSQEALRQQSIAARNEQSAWQQAQQQNSIDGYNLYLKNWPKGGHNVQAKRLQGELEEQARQANLSAEQQQVEQVKLAQQLLIQLGYKIADIGILDTRTQKAIESFEKEQKLLVTGQVDSVLISNLKQAYSDKDNNQWQLAKKSNTSIAYQTYIDAMPQGQYIKEAATEKSKALDREKQAADLVIAKDLKEAQEKQNEINALLEKGLALFSISKRLEAKTYFLQAADLGSPIAMGQLVRIFHREKNETETKKWREKSLGPLTALANQGDATAQYVLGGIYSEVDENYQKALQWNSIAAKHGSAIAQFNLGLMYSKGYGVDKDLNEAFKWYQKGAEQGYLHAQIMLGAKYYFGEGVTKDPKEAFKWYQKAAEQGAADAQLSLAFMYETGSGVESDLQKAFKWFKNSAEQGNAHAQAKLGLMYASGGEVERDLIEAFKWFKKSAEQGFPTGQYGLGLMYANGESVEKDSKEAVKWYQKAAEQGHVEAQNQLDKLKQVEMPSIVSGASIFPTFEGAEFSNGTSKDGESGVSVVSISANSPAKKIGLEKGDVIFGINRTRASTVIELKEVMSKIDQKVMALNIKRGSSTLYLVIR